MTDKEILAELKKSYDYLWDIRENGCVDHCCGQINNKETINALDVARENITKAYYDIYKTIPKEELRVEELEDNFKEDYKVYIAGDVSFDYEFVYNEEDVEMVSCGDIDYYWYNDYNFLDN